MNKKIAVSVFIPAHNEVETVIPLLRKTILTLNREKLIGEVIFVDDGSTDGTSKKVKLFVKNQSMIKRLCHTKKLGLTASFNDAFTYSRGEVIVFLPADLQSDPEEDIPKLIAKINAGYDVVIGHRLNRPVAEIIDSLTYNLLLRKVFNLKFHDMNWIKAFRCKSIKDLKLKSDWHRFLVPLLASKGASITEIPVQYFPRRHGKSKFGFKRIPRTLFDLVTIKVLMIFGKI